ncbi:MAG TPA: glycoside hydrolase family 2 TIM barrel-domain containing protein, partial [Phototrophicaceae bacterium]|nr:glycoside hydrolase family 2 TIM barrel-domain containing protein [Phototrophicaceae bacterium]
MSMPSLLELHGTRDISVPRLPLIELQRSSKTFTLEKIDQRGRFFFHKDQKFFLKGVTYGPFAPSADGVPFPERAKVDLDFALMSELGVNCFRTFTVPPKSLLDKAAAHGLRVIVGIPWPQHISFLDSKLTRSEIRATIARGVAECSSHPAVFAYLVGNEIPPEIVRWYGAGKIRKFLATLVDTAKSGDPGTLVSYANFPSTEYLETDFLDFVAFNVYLHREEDFRRYLSHLHNLAGDRPLVLTEIGIDSVGQGRQFQAEALSWQLRASFESGVAGTVVFSWTDDWHAYSGPEGF